MTNEGRRYVNLAAALKDLKADVPRYYEVVGEMDQIWRHLGELEHDEINGLLIAIDEVERTGKGYPPAESNTAANVDAPSTVEDLLKEFGTPDNPMPCAPPWHVEDPHHCAHGWTDGTTWGICDCEDPADPWPPRAPSDGPRDCSCFGCNDHRPRHERGRITACEYKDHHCDDCHKHQRCTIVECGFVTVPQLTAVSTHA